MLVWSDLGECILNLRVGVRYEGGVAVPRMRCSGGTEEILDLVEFSLLGNEDWSL